MLGQEFGFFKATAVVLFGLLIGASFLVSPNINKQVFALITEDSLRVQDQQTQGRLLKQGSYVYSFGYQPFINDDSGEGFGGGELSSSILIGNTAFLSLNSPAYDMGSNIGIFDNKRSGVVTYEVQSGDTPSYIAASFGISTNTLLWANNLGYWSIIKPGAKLTILPTSGVLHEVKKGESLDKIIKDYKGDLTQAIAYNGLPASGSLEVGQKIIIPNGTKPVISQPKTKLAYASVNTSIGPYGDKSHKFPWGQCTWYIAQKRYIPWSGHAKQWLDNARSYGFQTGIEPVPGAIISTKETWYGHVAYVESVTATQVVISEMSLGRGKIGIRVLDKNDKRIRGYIY